MGYTSMPIILKIKLLKIFGNRLLKTIKKNVHLYVTDEGINHIFIKPIYEPPLKLPRYHIMHTRQFLELFEITNDVY